MLKSIATKRSLFFLVVMLLFGMTTSFVQAGSYLYWTDFKSSAISRSTLEGTLKEDVRRDGRNTPFQIAVDPAAGDIYFTDFGDPLVSGDETIRKMNLDGSNEVVLMRASEGFIHHPAGIKLDIGSGKMYWVDSGQRKLGVHRANLDGTGYEWLIDIRSLRQNYGQGPGQTTEFAQSMALWLDLQNGLLYWTDYFNRDIHVADLEGSPESITASVRQILSGLPGARGITGYSGDPAIPGSGKLYWVTGFSGEVMWGGLDGSNPETIISAKFGTKLKYPADIAYGDGRIYFTDKNSGDIYSANADGGVDVIHLLTLQHERLDKPGRFIKEEPFGIALFLDPAEPTSPLPAPPLPAPPTPAPPTPVPATPVPAPAPLTPAPSITSISYRSARGEWKIEAVMGAVSGTPVTFDIVVYSRDLPGVTQVISSDHPSGTSSFVKLKGVGLLAGIPETNLRAKAVATNGTESSAAVVRVR